MWREPQTWRKFQEVNTLTVRNTSKGRDRWRQKAVSCTRRDHFTGSAHSDTLATDLSRTVVVVGGVEGARALLQAPSAWLVLAMWPCAAPGPTPGPNAPLWWPEWPVGVCL